MTYMVGVNVWLPEPYRPMDEPCWLLTVVVELVEEFVQGLELVMREYELIVRPYRARCVVDLDFELGHHAEVVAGASEGPEEIWI